MEKIKTILIDSEEEFLLRLEQMADWSRYGFEVAGRAHSGKEGLTLYRAVKPDLIISEVDLPQLSGIQMIEEIRKQDQDTKVIFLSHCEDFHAARMALGLEVSDYLLKSELTKEQLSCRLKELSKQVETERNMLRREFELAVFEYFSHDKTGEPGASEEIEQLFHRRYCVLLVTLKQPLPILRLLSNLAVAPKKKFHADLLEPHLQSEGFSICGIVDQLSDGILFLLQKREEGFTGQGVNEFAVQLSAQLEEFFGSEFIVNILTQDASIFESKRLFAQYSSQAQVNYFFQKSPINYLGLNLYHEELEVDFELSKVKAYIRNYDKEGLCRYIQQVYTSIFKNYSYQALSNITGHLLVLMEDYRFRLKDTEEWRPLFSPEDVNCWTSVYGISGWLQEKFSDLISGLRYSINKEYSETVNRAIQYIARHYEDPALCLERIEKHVGISYSRLCILFKQETSISINSFIIDYRMKKAQELLRDSTKKIGEVAQEVGFASTSYFCKVFKKSTGISPLGYKGKVKKQKEAV